MKLVQGLVLSSFLVLLCHCGFSVEAACQAIISAQCEKIIECTPQSERDKRPELKDQASCEADAAKTISCEPEKACSSQPEKYNGAKAKACVNEFRALTCGQIIGGNAANAPSCASICDP